MATYKEIKGVTVQTLDEDPVVREAGATWASGGTLNTARDKLKVVLQALKHSHVFGGEGPGFSNAQNNTMELLGLRSLI